MKHSRARSAEAIEFARFQRATSNDIAATIWQWIRNRQTCNQKFRRQYPIPPYTADFCCVELKLILEVDGAAHFTDTGKDRDQVRDEFLSREGYRIVRISGFDVLRDGVKVLARIKQEVRKRMVERIAEESPSPPAPLPEAGRGEKGN
jgi:very-short-patch-repair endonuclease